MFSVKSVDIANNTVKENGGGFFLTKMVEGVIQDSPITGNIAGGQGGGIFILESNVAFSDCKVTHNSATAGGGVLLQLSTPILGSLTQFNSCNFTENLASDLGGGIAVAGGPDATLPGNTTSGTFALEVSRVLQESYSELYQEGLLDEVSYAQVVRQQLEEEAAATACEEEESSSCYVSEVQEDQWTFKNCLIVGNMAERAGGGIFVGSQYLERVRFGPNRTVIHNNYAAEMGGGVFIQQGRASAWLFNGDFENK